MALKVIICCLKIVYLVRKNKGNVLSTTRAKMCSDLSLRLSVRPFVCLSVCPFPLAWLSLFLEFYFFSFSPRLFAVILWLVWFSLGNDSPHKQTRLPYLSSLFYFIFLCCWFSTFLSFFFHICQACFILSFCVADFQLFFVFFDRKCDGTSSDYRLHNGCG